MNNQIVSEDFSGTTTYKELRRLYSVNQLIRKFVMQDRTTTNKYYFINGTGFLIGANNSNIHAEVMIYDAPILKSIPYFELDADLFFEWEKTNKKFNSLVWNKGSLSVSCINFETGEGNAPYTSYVNQTQVKKHFESRKNTLAIFMDNKDIVYRTTNDSRYECGIADWIYNSELLTIMDIADTFPTTRIGFSNNPNEPLVIMNHMDKREMDKRLSEDVVTYLQIPKKWLFKFEKGDILNITIKRLTNERYMAMFEAKNKRYGKRQFIECNVAP